MLVHKVISGYCEPFCWFVGFAKISNGKKDACPLQFCCIKYPEGETKSLALLWDNMVNLHTDQFNTNINFLTEYEFKYIHKRNFHQIQISNWTECIYGMYLFPGTWTNTNIKYICSKQYEWIWISNIEHVQCKLLITPSPRKVNF